MKIALPFFSRSAPPSEALAQRPRKEVVAAAGTEGHHDLHGARQVLRGGGMAGGQAAEQAGGPGGQGSVGQRVHLVSGLRRCKIDMTSVLAIECRSRRPTAPLPVPTAGSSSTPAPGLPKAGQRGTGPPEETTLPTWLQAGAWGLLAGGALVVGAAIGYFVQVPARAVAGVMAWPTVARGTASARAGSRATRPARAAAAWPLRWVRCWTACPSPSSSA